MLTQWQGPIYVDREGAAYRAMALEKVSFLGLLRPSMLLESLRARREGHRQGKVQGDPWQLGGTAIVAPGGHVLYAYRNRGPEDEAPLDTVVAALPPHRAP